MVLLLLFLVLGLVVWVDVSNISYISFFKDTVSRESSRTLRTEDAEFSLSQFLLLDDQSSGGSFLWWKALCDGRTVLTLTAAAGVWSKQVWLEAENGEMGLRLGGLGGLKISNMEVVCSDSRWRLFCADGNLFFLHIARTENAVNAAASSWPFLSLCLGFLSVAVLGLFRVLAFGPCVGLVVLGLSPFWGGRIRWRREWLASLCIIATIITPRRIDRLSAAMWVRLSGSTRSILSVYD
nr:hypothetical protein Iba_chr07aCG15670 [Ipomoea batatas]